MSVILAPVNETEALLTFAMQQTCAMSEAKNLKLMLLRTTQMSTKIYFVTFF